MMCAPKGLNRLVQLDAEVVTTLMNYPMIICQECAVVAWCKEALHSCKNVRCARMSNVEVFNQRCGQIGVLSQKLHRLS